jgi:hypothetical protein
MRQTRKAKSREGEREGEREGRLYLDGSEHVQVLVQAAWVRWEDRHGNQPCH